MSCIQGRKDGADKDFCRDLCCPVFLTLTFVRETNWHKHCIKVCGLNVQNAGDGKGDKPGITMITPVTHLEAAWTHNLIVCKVQLHLELLLL